MPSFIVNMFANIFNNTEVCVSYNGCFSDRWKKILEVLDRVVYLRQFCSISIWMIFCLILTLYAPVRRFLHVLPKILFWNKKGSSKNFLWASRLWVGRRKEPILDYVPKNDKKKEFRQQWVNKVLAWDHEIKHPSVCWRKLLFSIGIIVILISIQKYCFYWQY